MSDQVFTHFQHAMVSFLLWSYGGATKAFDYGVYPCGHDQFPHFRLSDASPVMNLSPEPDGQARPLAIHMLAQEPGPLALASYARDAVRPSNGGPLWGCLLLIGSLQIPRSQRGGTPSGRRTLWDPFRT